MDEKEHDEREVETFECSMCHHLYPVSQAATMGTRQLCAGCASQWFNDDDEETR